MLLGQRYVIIWTRDMRINLHYVRMCANVWSGRDAKQEADFRLVAHCRDGPNRAFTALKSIAVGHMKDR